MYSVVLMAALTTSVDLPDRGGCRGGCHGCRGGCHGCRGGGYGCCGCWGGGYGGGYGGCWGGGGYGGCMGMGYGGCMGMGYGGCMGMGMGYGGCGGMGMGYGGCGGMGGISTMGGMGMTGTILQGGTIQQGGEQLQKKGTSKEEEVRVPTPATIVVQLPADAKLRIENEATTSTGTSRVFRSPALNPGKEYHYTLTAEVVRNGKPVKLEQVVAVKAGQITPVRLNEPSASVAQR